MWRSAGSWAGGGIFNAHIPSLGMLCEVDNNNHDGDDKQDYNRDDEED